MTAKDWRVPGQSDSGAAKAAAKQARLADALRANLGRRKAQARARAPAVDSDVPPSKPPRSA
ncbi:MAG TPA: hypothetical protein VET84_01785 [Stellaceae bacterium]|jgi:hypothetical protein|nr:hypothetical protein [Stellaceae bacterium]